MTSATSTTEQAGRIIVAQHNAGRRAQMFSALMVLATLGYCTYIKCPLLPWVDYDSADAGREAAAKAGQPPTQQKAPVSTKTENGATPAISIPDCNALRDDALFLEAVFEEVREPSYKASKKMCERIIARLDERFPSDWKASHRIPDTSTRGEPAVTGAARVFYMTCVNIVRDFACTGDKKLVAEFGESVVPGFERDFLRYVQEDEWPRSGASSPHEAVAAALSPIDNVPNSVVSRTAAVDPTDEVVVTTPPPRTRSATNRSPSA